MRINKLNTSDRLASLSVRQVRWARRQYESGTKTMQEIADKLKVSMTTISFMLNGKTYRHVK